jgi:hypothetical protein
MPMGSKMPGAQTPHFRFRAVGSLEELPGCPEAIVRALGAGRTDAVCLGKRYHPSDCRCPITRIEVVRIRPQLSSDERLEELVEDPWRVLPCPADGEGGGAEFSDAGFLDSALDAVDYVRAIEAPTPLIHCENPLGYQFEGEGRCVEVAPCGINAPATDDCLSEGEPRAWSSPIFVDCADPDGRHPYDGDLQGERPMRRGYSG